MPKSKITCMIFNPEVTKRALEYGDVYVMLDPDATFSFVSPLVAMNFEILSKILVLPFQVSASVGDLVVGKKSL